MAILPQLPTFSRRAHAASAVACLLVVAALGGCAASAPPFPDEIKDPARRAYYEGVARLKDGDYVKAAQILQVVAASPRHVKHAALAKLRLGDALFFQGRYAESAEVYRGFVGQYKTDPNLPYARYMVARSFHKRLPSDWFLIPPAYEMDQSITQQAEGELKSFLTTFPTSPFAPEVRKMLAETRGMLFAREMYAVDFYADRDKWQAVAWRLGDALQTYPELAMKDALVWRFVGAWDKVGDPGETAKALGMYLEHFPDGKHHGAAKERLEVMRKAIEAREKAATPKVPPADPNGPKVPPTKIEPTDPTEPDAPEDPETPPDEDEPKLKQPVLPELDPSADPK